MIIYPAVDISQGRCVRLRRGDPGQKTDFGDPVEAALRWKSEGAQWLHVVDLDGAFSGKSENAEVIREIVTRTGLPVEMGGGIRNIKTIRTCIEEIGAARVVLGTVAIEFPELVIWALNKYEDKIAVGIDARDGRVAVKGWAKESDTDALTLADRLHELGASTFVYTNISKDGMMQGPDLEGTRRMAQKTGADIIASGGVSSLADISAVRETGASGCIVGRALFDGAFTLPAAIEAAQC